MKFVMSYSCGKDSTLALHKMLADGHQAVALIVMCNPDADRSYFHGADYQMLEEYSKALDIPLLLTPTKGEEYHLNMEESLRKAMTMGAEAACFGDIDIEGNRAWCEKRCKNVNIKAVFPLWHRDRAENVYELIDLGYKCVIKALKNNLIPRELLGRILDLEAVEVMKKSGIDICGENGEYHTLAVDGPIFKHPLPYKLNEIADIGDHSYIDITVK